MDILTLAIAKSKYGSANGTITTDSIIDALGYTPVSQKDISKLSDENIALEALVEFGVVVPLVDENNTIFTDENGTIYVL